jgi:type IV pilus assembly protein PilO
MSVPVQLLVAVVIAGVIVGGGYFLLLKPMMAENDAAQQKLADLRKQNDSLRHFMKDLPILEAKIASLKQQLEVSKLIVPDEKQADQFLDLMQETAMQAGVEVRRYTTKPIVTHDFYSEMPFDVDIDGPYYSVLKFFEQTAKLERIINISGMKMATPKRNSEAGVKKTYQFAPGETVVSNITATTFFSHEPEVKPAAPAKPGTPGAPAPAAAK